MAVANLAFKHYVRLSWKLYFWKDHCVVTTVVVLVMVRMGFTHPHNTTAQHTEPLFQSGSQFSQQLLCRCVYMVVAVQYRESVFLITQDDK